MHVCVSVLDLRSPRQNQCAQRFSFICFILYFHCPFFFSVQQIGNKGGLYNFFRNNAAFPQSASRIKKNERNYPPEGSSVHQKIKTATVVVTVLVAVVEVHSSTLNGVF